MNKSNLEVMCNIIGAVESGGQIYGNRRYDAYAGAYANTPNEVTCTLGWAQNYGNEGRKLCQMILAKDTAAFRRADTADIEGRLSDDWIAMRWNPNEKQKKALIAIITTPAGKTCQDELFSQLIEKYVAKAKEFDPSMSTKAQAMWCEIEHLGGLTPVQRIFKRASKPYTVESIIASLAKDKNDTSSSNQVGDQKFQSRHDCCAKWVNQYIKEEGATTMSIMVGSARIDERGNIAGGVAGDQTGREVAEQEFYMHDLGWLRSRPVSADVANKIAKAMRDACANNHIGYDQGNRVAVSMVKKYGSLAKVAENAETDCSNLVRACIYEATGRDLGEFYTGNEPAVLNNSGIFEPAVRITSSSQVKNGDVLTTCSKGHTVIVTSGAPRTGTLPAGKTLNEIPKWVGKVTRAKLPVRVWAGKNFEQIKSWPLLNTGNLVDVCDSLKAANGLTWYYIRIAGKFYGFVRSKYIKRV